MPRQSLRQATRNAHDALENLPIMHRLLSPRVGMADYRALLAHLHGAFADYCPLLEGAVGDCAHPQLAATDLPAYLEADLRALDCWPSVVTALPPAPAPRSAAEALGAWYVLEGSALGGAVIASQLRKALGPSLPVSYFATRDARPDSRWQCFEDHFERLLSDPARLAGITTGANLSYRFIAAVLQQADG